MGSFLSKEELYRAVVHFGFCGLALGNSTNGKEAGFIKRSCTGWFESSLGLIQKPKTDFLVTMHVEL